MTKLTGTEYITSPYTPQNIESVKVQRLDKEGSMVFKDTGEVKPVVYLGALVTIERDELAFCKLFQYTIQETARMGIPGMRMVLYIMARLKPNSFEIEIIPDAFLDFCGYEANEKGRRSKTPYYYAINELLTRDYISRKKYYRYTFFINVNKVFNGDRVRALKLEEKRKLRLRKEKQNTDGVTENTGEQTEEQTDGVSGN